MKKNGIVLKVVSLFSLVLLSSSLASAMMRQVEEEKKPKPEIQLHDVLSTVDELQKLILESKLTIPLAFTNKANNVVLTELINNSHCEAYKIIKPNSKLT